MNVRRISVAAGLTLLSIGCSSGTGGDGSTSSLTSLTLPVQPDSSDSVASPCEGFEERYVGAGLFVPLPPDARGLTGQTTADLGPIHAASSVDFDLGDGVVVTVGAGSPARTLSPSWRPRTRPAAMPDERLPVRRIERSAGLSPPLEVPRPLATRLKPRPA